MLHGLRAARGTVRGRARATHAHCEVVHVLAEEHFEKTKKKLNVKGVLHTVGVSHSITTEPSRGVSFW